MVGKDATEEGVLYELVLTLKNGNTGKADEAISILSQSEGIKNAQRNEKFAPPKSTIFLDKSVIYLEKGAEADLSIKSVNLIENPFQNIGVRFSVNPKIFDENSFDRDSFKDFGIDNFWPNTEIGEDILVKMPEELEAAKSEDSIYYGWVANSESIFDTANRLAEQPGILSVSIVRMAVPAGMPPYEDWDVNKDGIIELKLSGGNVAAGFGENGPRLNQTAKIKGEKQGIVVVTVNRGYSAAEASDNCVVIVYEPGGTNNPGDINHDGKIEIEDAIYVLKHLAKVELLDETETADLNQNGRLDLEDALIMLKIAAKIIG